MNGAASAGAPDSPPIAYVVTADAATAYGAVMARMVMAPDSPPMAYAVIAYAIMA